MAKLAETYAKVHDKLKRKEQERNRETEAELVLRMTIGIREYIKEKVYPHILKVAKAGYYSTYFIVEEPIFQSILHRLPEFVNEIGYSCSWGSCGSLDGKHFPYSLFITWPKPEDEDSTHDDCRF